VPGDPQRLVQLPLDADLRDGQHPAANPRCSRRAASALTAAGTLRPGADRRGRGAIRAQRPAVVFAPHVETASGMMLPDDYLRAVADAVREVGGLFVLDCIASGTIWVDMRAPASTC
jgi:4-aminobutyrate aminotransferase-like enzyme